MGWFTPARRRWIYGIAIPLGPLLGYYGLVNDQSWALWLAVLEQVLVPAMALRFVPGGSGE